MEITIKQNLLQANEEKAAEIRELLRSKRVLSVNLIGSPGAGKTTLLENTISVLAKKYKVAVIEGDVATDRDAERLRKCNVPVLLVNTDGACHLESVSIEKALVELDLDSLDIIFIENIGNLVCPAEFDVGEDAKVAVASVPEGDDKVAKYPLLFREATFAILNKIDLLQYTYFDRQRFYEDLNKVNSGLQVTEVSCKEQESLIKWLSWLEDGVSKKQRG